MTSQDPEFYPSIQDWLQQTHNTATPVAPQELVAYVRARTGLTEMQCKLIISGFFSEVIDLLLNKRRIFLDELGLFYIAKHGRLMWDASLSFKKEINAIIKQK